MTDVIECRFRRGAKTGDTQKILGPRTASLFLPATAKKACHPPPRPYQKGANTRRSADLVRRQAGIVEAEPVKVQMPLAQHLHHVAVRCQSGVPGDANHLFDRLQDTRFVVGGHNRNQRAPACRFGHLVDRLPQRIEINPSLAVNADHRRIRRRLKNRIMFDRTGYDPVKSRQNEIIGFRAAAGEHDIGRPAAGQHRHLGPCRLHGHARMPPEGMNG